MTVRVFAVCFAVLGWVSTPAHAVIEAMVLGGPNASTISATKTTTLATQTSSAYLGFQAGVGLGLPLLSRSLILESQVFYTDRVLADSSTIYTFHSLHNPLLARFRFSESFSIAAGPFQEFSLWSVGAKKKSSDALAPLNSTVSYEDASLKKNQYGFEGSMQFKFPSGGSQFLLDLRYYKTLVNVSRIASVKRLFSGAQVNIGMLWGAGK